jgi:hypothetical protein
LIEKRQRVGNEAAAQAVARRPSHQAGYHFGGPFIEPESFPFVLADLPAHLVRVCFPEFFEHVVYGPNISGRSRQGAPERKTQKMH